MLGLKLQNHGNMRKEIIQTKQAPAPIGPYSQAVLVGNTLYTSGQIALHPETGALLCDDIETETTRVMVNLKAVLHAADMDFTNVVKCSIFLSDMENFPRVNAVYARYFDESQAPARETVQVERLPKSVNVEISAIAVKP